RVGAGGAASVSTEARDPYRSSVRANWSRETTDDRTMVPETVRGATTDLADFLRRWPRPDDDEGNPESRAVIVDQFEELFTAFPDRWAAREDFVDGIRDALADDPALRIVLAIREDYIAHLDALAPRLPGGLRTRHRLEPLRRDSALAAVTGPLAGTRRSFA